jgi:hypothetical protein
MKRALALVLALAPATAAAQPGRDPAAAEALFKKGVEALEKDDWAGACPSFEASVKLDPSVGAQLNVARCAEHDGKLARAWAEYKKAKVLNQETPGAKRKREVDAFVDDALSKLEPRLPKVTVRLASKPAGVRVERDGVELPMTSLELALPVDPGTHVMVATAPGHEDLRETFEIAEGARKEIVLSLVPKAGTPPPPVPTPAPPPDAPAPRPVPEAQGEGGIDLVVLGAAIGSIGAASLAVAAITGGIAASDNATLEDLEGCERSGETLSCPGSTLEEARDAASRGETLSVASTVTLFAGAAVAATGLTLVIVGATSSSPSKTGLEGSLFASPDAVGLRVFGRY